MGGGESYPSTEMYSAYSPAPDFCFFFFFFFFFFFYISIFSSINNFFFYIP